MTPELTEENALSELALALAKYRYDFHGFMLWAWPWGEVGGPLEREAAPDKWQSRLAQHVTDSLQEDRHRTVKVAYASGHGIGKAQPDDMVIDTPSGPRRWGDLVVGDHVFGASGQSTAITAVFKRGLLQTYRVRLDDGGETLACGDHLWTVRGRQQRRYGGDESVTLSTDQIMAMGVKRPNGAARARQWELPRIGALEMPHADLPLDAYTLGVWLGDGGRNSGRITSCDYEVIERLRGVGETVSDCADIAWGIRGIAAKLRALGILDRYSYEKGVPQLYRVGSAEQRAELLRGLMDTDGEAGKQGSAVFSSTSRQLADDVVWLARSLGGKAGLQPTTKMPFYRDRDGNLKAGRPCHRVTVTMPSGFRLFYITRKQARLRAVEPRYLSRWIDSIEPDEVVDCTCIAVEAEDHLYLTTDLIPTHNTAMEAMTLLWAFLTYQDCRGRVTANNDNQLKSVTWAELTKWFWMLDPTLRNQFEITATALYSRHEGHEKAWRIDAVPWSAANPAAFAGLHNAGKRIIFVMDEGSGIPDVVYDVMEGATTDADTEIIVLVMGNPTKPTGRFFEIVAGRFRSRWITAQIDSRTVKRTDKADLNEKVVAWGLDSDYVRVRVLGQFPRIGDTQLISAESVRQARVRDTGYIPSDPLVAGLDVARFGDDSSVLAARRGRDARTVPWRQWRGTDTMTLAGDVALWCEKYQPQALFVDIGGMGVGVYDRLVQLAVPNVYPINFGGEGGITSYDGVSVRVFNKAAAMQVQVREWLKTGAIPDDDHLQSDLVERLYGFDAQGALRLERKEDMKRRGLASPDKGDALALTFAMPVGPISTSGDMLLDMARDRGVPRFDGLQVVGDYDIHADIRG